MYKHHYPQPDKQMLRRLFAFGGASLRVFPLVAPIPPPPLLLLAIQ